MPINLDFFRIEFLDFYQPNSRACALHFKIEPDHDGKKFLDVFFTDEFMEDFFSLPDVARKKVEKIFEHNRKLFLQWGLIKIEEMLNRRSFKKRIVVSSENDLQWAKNVKEGRYIFSSKPLEENVFQFFHDPLLPERKIIGFQPNK